jgi:hypothetical protein
MTNEYAFCETIAACTTHIRVLTDRGRKEGGGADTLALCGAKAEWDTKTPFSAALVVSWDPWPYALCRQCKTCFEREHMRSSLSG